jgi:hypothetical protein
MGADQDAIADGRGLGIKAEKVVNSGPQDKDKHEIRADVQSFVLVARR